MHAKITSVVPIDWQRKPLGQHSLHCRVQIFPAPAATHRPDSQSLACVQLAPASPRPGLAENSHGLVESVSVPSATV